MDEQDLFLNDDGVLLRRVWNAILTEEEGVSVINPKRVKQFLFCDKMLRILFAGKGVKINSIPNTELPSVGIIEMTSRQFEISDTMLFHEITALADNYEIYPKIDGTVQINFSFFGMTKK